MGRRRNPAPDAASTFRTTSIGAAARAAAAVFASDSRCRHPAYYESPDRLTIRPRRRNRKEAKTLTAIPVNGEDWNRGEMRIGNERQREKYRDAPAAAVAPVAAPAVEAILAAAAPAADPSTSLAAPATRRHRFR